MVERCLQCFAWANVRERENLEDPDCRWKDTRVGILILATLL